MKNLALLACVAFLVLLAAPAAAAHKTQKGKANAIIDWNQADCDPGGAPNAKNCCKEPKLKSWAVQIDFPTDATCLPRSEIATVKYHVVENPGGKLLQPKGGAVYMVTVPDIPDATTDDGLNFVYPLCVGNGEPRTARFVVSAKDLPRDPFVAHLDKTWGLYFLPLPDGVHEAALPYASSITSNATGGFWIADDCDQLAKDICDGKIKDAPPKNRFYLDAKAKCRK